MTNSADPDQLASEEANWSGSALFAKKGHVMFRKRRVKTAGCVENNKDPDQTPNSAVSDLALLCMLILSLCPNS